MRFPKQTLAAAAFACMTVTTTSHGADAPQLTADEQATLDLYHRFVDCANNKTKEIQTAAAQNKEIGVAIAKARGAAGDKATRDAALAAGVPSEAVDNLMAQLETAEGQYIGQVLTQMLPEPRAACVAELGIDNERDGAKLKALAEKHGEALFEREAAAKPKP